MKKKNIENTKKLIKPDWKEINSKNRSVNWELCAQENSKTKIKRIKPKKNHKSSLHYNKIPLHGAAAIKRNKKESKRRTGRKE